MWRITIIANALMMGLFWLASLLSVSIAYNRFVQYPASKSPMVLPSPTEFALSIQLWAGILPLAWSVLSYVIWQKVKDKEPEARSECLLAFTSITMIVGFLMFIFFALAGTLPFFFIKTLVK
ncbi:MAG: hypothetical protein PVJ20_13670 [Desulfobacterales bacterium]|jgi:hypothetical protein